MNFHETKIGQHFFNRQLPALINALEKTAAALSQPVHTILPPESPDKEFLSTLCNSTFDPERYQSLEKMQSLNQQAAQAEQALREQLTPQTFHLLDAYESMTFARSDTMSELAFESGFRTAVQMMLAGRTLPKKEDYGK